MSPRRPTELTSALPLLLVLVLATGGCGGSGDLPLDQVDPDAAPADPTYQEVFAILHNRCVSCHTGDGDDGGEYAPSPNRAVAGGVEPNLEDCTEIVGLRDDILQQVEANTMPPGAMPRLRSDEKLLIRRWVENGAPAPCN